ncbi:hypothetical protein AAGS61_06825 [Lysinibacillus sp. KU-BSD001]|uniref:hypothetical protein n=1 Tax=Lysinibacillus sp. KU-BSD001 TaxID=3141328 RepID=UPI0036F056B2
MACLDLLFLLLTLRFRRKENLGSCGYGALRQKWILLNILEKHLSSLKETIFFPFAHIVA